MDREDRFIIILVKGPQQVIPKEILTRPLVFGSLKVNSHREISIYGDGNFIILAVCKNLVFVIRLRDAKKSMRNSLLNFFIV